MNVEPQPDILNIEEAARLLGVSIKTFNKRSIEIQSPTPLISFMSCHSQLRSVRALR